MREREGGLDVRGEGTGWGVSRGSGAVEFAAEGGSGFAVVAGGGFRAGGFPHDIRKEFIAYYKWIVNLATFVLTVSLSLVGLFAQGVTHQRLLVLGWILLGTCVFLNWILVNRLVTIPIVDAVGHEEEGPHHRRFRSTMGSMKIYGLIQNLAFLLGVFFVSIGLVLNLR